MNRESLVALWLAIVAAGAAHAQEQPATFDAAKQMVGTWEISNADRDRRCTVMFSIDAVPGGLKLALDPGCAMVFPALKDVVSWTVATSGPLRLLDAKGAAALELSEVESGIFEGERRGEGLYFLQPQAAISIPTRTPDQLAGDWNFLREIDKTLCVLSLSTAAVPGGGFKLTTKQGCDAAIAAFGFTSWQLEGDQLVFSGRGGAWRFVESDVNIWERVPPSTNPLLMMKP